MNFTEKFICILGILGILGVFQKLLSTELTDHIGFTLLNNPLIVVPQNTWHRFHAPNGVSIVTATPRPTEHLTVNVEDPRTLGDAERAANSEEKVR